ncbi:hypothetical protein V1509DRAFT_614094 [Lipomyces kononenkoae]
MALSPVSGRHHSVPFTLRREQQHLSSPTTPNSVTRLTSELIVRKQRQKADTDVGCSPNQETRRVPTSVTGIKPLMDANTEKGLLPYHPKNVRIPVADNSTLPPLPEYQLPAAATYQGCYVPMPALGQTLAPASRASSYDHNRYVQRKPVDSQFINKQRASSDYTGSARRRKGQPDIDETMLEVIAQLKLYLTIIKLAVCAIAWMFNTLLGIAVFIFIFGNGLVERLPRSKLATLAAGWNTEWFSSERVSSPTTNTSRARKSSEMIQPSSGPIQFVSSRP